MSSLLRVLPVVKLPSDTEFVQGLYVEMRPIYSRSSILKVFPYAMLGRGQDTLQSGLHYLAFYHVWREPPLSRFLLGRFARDNIILPIGSAQERPFAFLFGNDKSIPGIAYQAHNRSHLVNIHIKILTVTFLIARPASCWCRTWQMDGKRWKPY